MRLKAVEITWQDSMHQSGWHKLSDNIALTKAELEHRTVGYVIHDTADVVAVVQSVSLNGFSADSTMTIPKSCILKMRPLR
jgi:hypothetical protein